MYSIDDIQIFILTYNRENYLKNAIDSILNQTAGVKEITVLDNNSTDNTEEVVLSYKDRGVKYVKTFGHSGNPNEARKLASKNYIMLFHDDDILHPEYFELVLNILNSNENISVLTSRFKFFFNEDIPDYSKKLNNKYFLFNNQKGFAEYLYFKGGIAYAPAIYKTEHFLQIDHEFDKFSKHVDYPFMVKAAKYGKSVVLNDRNAFLMRKHATQDSVTDENPVTIEQYANHLRFFYDILEGNLRGKNGLRSFFPRKKYTEDELFDIANKYNIIISRRFQSKILELSVQDDRLYLTLFGRFKTKLWPIYIPPKCLKIENL